MAKPDFRSALQQADRALQEKGLSAEADARLRRRLADGAHRADGPAASARRWWPVAAVAACAAVALVLWQRPSVPPPTRDGPSELGGLAVLSATADLEVSVVPEQGSPGPLIDVAKGGCTLFDHASGTAVKVAGRTRLRREPSGVRILRGRVDVAVHERAPSMPPARVLVSHGVIEIMGTRFTVEQKDASGEVTLHEGAIRFLDERGRATNLTPGESLSWPPGHPEAAIAPLPAAAEEPPAPHAATVPRPPKPVEELLSEIAVLRSRGLYAQAAADLTRAIGQPYPSPVRERLSFELGSILSDQLGDRARACEHWRAHDRRYPQGRYRKETGQAQERFGCAKLGR